MKRILSLLLFLAVLSGSLYSQNLPDLKLKNSKSLFNSSKLVSVEEQKNAAYEKAFQLKTRKTVTSYFGAGYSFMIFTSGYMADAFPVLDTRNGSFLTNISVFFGFAIAKAVTMEIEPTILFTSNNQQVDYELTEPLVINNIGRKYAHTYTNGIIALPMALNVRFFPMFMQKGFSRLIFIGGGVGAAWISEENDVYYNNSPTTYNFDDPYRAGISTSQWAPVFKIMAGVTGTGGQFGFGGELRYNIIPLNEDKNLPFATRFAKNFNSVDITLRFYFSL
jgi:hypothetical protein